MTALRIARAVLRVRIARPLITAAAFRAGAFLARRCAGLRRKQVGICIVVRAPGAATRRATATLLRPRAAMPGPPARIPVRLVLTGLAAFGARRVGTFLDLELRWLDEIDLALEQLLDVAQVAELIG